MVSHKFRSWIGWISCIWSPFCSIYPNFTKKIQFKDDVTFDYPSLGMASFLFLKTDSVHDITFAVFQRSLNIIANNFTLPLQKRILNTWICSRNELQSWSNCMNLYGRVKQNKSSRIEICLRYVLCSVFVLLCVSQF